MKIAQILVNLNDGTEFEYPDNTLLGVEDLLELIQEQHPKTSSIIVVYVKGVRE